MAASQTIRTLKLSLLADTAQFGKDLGKAGNSFRDFSRGVERASAFAVGALGAIGTAAFEAVNLASDLEETGNKVGEIFGAEGRRQLEEYAATANRSLGQTRRQALDAAATFGIFGQAAGLSGDDLIDFSTELTTLATDLASFNNTDVDQAIVAIGAALRGESEPIRNYGVLLNDATLKSRAAALGLIEDVNSQLSVQDRVLAAQAEILAQTSSAQGDFQRTSDGIANQQRILTARFEDFRTELGEQLLPVAEELLPKIEGLLDRLEGADPERLVELGAAIAQVAAGVVALNAALKAFAAVQGAARFLFSTVGAVGLLALAGGSAPVLPPDEQRRVDIAAEGRIANRAPRASLSALSQRQRALQGTGQTNIIVNGFVGDEYRLAAAVQRARDAAARRGQLVAPGVPQ